MTVDLSKRMLIVTGASTGIGRAIAERLAQDGYSVFAGVRNAAAHDALQSLGRPNLHPLRLDVTEPESIARALCEVQAHASRAQGTLYGLINNAAVCVTGPLESVPLSALRQQLEVNLLGVVGVTQAALPALLAARGRVINIGSNVARLTPPFLGSYAASKAALEAISDAFRRELAVFGVDVSLIVPGPVMTPVWDKISAASIRWNDAVDDDVRQRYRAALQRFVAINGESARRSRLTSADVAALVARCLGSAAPRPRYEIGLGANAGTWISRLVPLRWVDRAFRQALKPRLQAGSQ